VCRRVKLASIFVFFDAVLEDSPAADLFFFFIATIGSTFV
jgi:hypothetical protein